MVAQGLTDKVTNDKLVTFYFPSCGTIPPPVIMVQVNNTIIIFKNTFNKFLYFFILIV